MEHDDKPLSVAYFRAYQRRVRGARSVVIVGGGAVGVQMATDLKEIYPDKDVTLVHSRDRLMPLYHEKMDEILRARFQELGIRLITGARAVVPDGGFPADASGLEVVLQDGRRIAADLVIPATGQIPNTEFLRDLESRSDTPIVNPQNGFVHVRPTLQFQDPAYPHLFAAGDIADSGAHKAARPGMGQAQVVARNVLALIQGQAPAETVTISPPAIHITLGTKKNMVFRNPNPKEGQVEPVVILREDGREDMNIEGVWERRGVQVSRPEDYHL
ncbi:hypothetical protein VTK73DRAFT_4023 [Phialemonium thermophilum]|uniref:FAD/NAD(P)-binding domain-containing protein n=1 Tax=Phialemonium thermophilum TaxID=223376 RepID=A0ABR3WVQ1_9PEZI